MASEFVSRNGAVPSRSTSSSTTPHQQPSLIDHAARFVESQQVARAPHRLELPRQFIRLEPPKPLSAFIDDPNVNEAAAAAFLGVSPATMRKWRGRDQGPNYIQYGPNGPVRYPLNALKAYMVENMVITGMKGGRK